MSLVIHSKLTDKSIYLVFIKAKPLGHDVDFKTQNRANYSPMGNALSFVNHIISLLVMSIKNALNIFLSYPATKILSVKMFFLHTQETYLDSFLISPYKFTSTFHQYNVVPLAIIHFCRFFFNPDHSKPTFFMQMNAGNIFSDNSRLKGPESSLFR